jgi:hypothetical protein
MVTTLRASLKNYALLQKIPWDALIRVEFFGDRQFRMGRSNSTARGVFVRNLGTVFYYYLDPKIWVNYALII